MNKHFKTEQEAFWGGEFGNQYIDRNNSDEIVESCKVFFEDVFRNISKDEINSIIEFGANVGMNLKGIKQILPNLDCSAVEINHRAATLLKNDPAFNGSIAVYEESILDYTPTREFDFVLIKGVLIHINPDELDQVYQRLYDASKKYICIAEYYSTTPVSLPYRGYSDRLFKRDFAGEFLDRYSNVRLVDYKFVWRRDDPLQDDITWFLLKKC